MNDDTLVTGTTGEVGTTSEPTPATGVADATSQSSPADAKEMQVDYAARLERLNQDLNAMKSTFQRRESQLSKEWQERESQYLRQIEQLRLATMDEDERKVYESTATVRQLNELQEALQTVSAQREEAESKLKAQQYFISQGVPVNKLELGQSYDDLWASGMAYLTEELSQLRKRASTPQAASNPPVIQAPAVVTANNAPASVGPQWSDLVKQYGDEESVYRLVETGQLSPDIIPIPGKR
jgi:hypothetical protein